MLTDCSTRSSESPPVWGRAFFLIGGCKTLAGNAVGFAHRFHTILPLRVTRKKRSSIALALVFLVVGTTAVLGSTIDSTMFCVQMIAVSYLSLRASAIVIGTLKSFATAKFCVDSTCYDTTLAPRSPTLLTRRRLLHMPPKGTRHVLAPENFILRRYESPPYSQHYFEL